MKIVGVGVAALIVASCGTALGQGLGGGPTTSDYARKLLDAKQKQPTTTTLPSVAKAGKRPGKARAPKGSARGARGVLLGEDAGKTAAVQQEPWRGRLEAITDPAKLPGAVTAMGKQAEDLTADDVAALIGIANRSPHRRAAAPEMRDALRKIAQEHPTRSARREAAAAADALELNAHLVELRRHVDTMRAAGKRGVEIWSEIAKRSVDYHKGRTDITDRQKFDEVVADLGVLFNGSDAKRHLETYERSFGMLPFADPNVDTAIRALQRRDANAGFAPQVDTTQGLDFRPEFRDGTKGQVYHTNFFLVLGYAAGDNVTSIAMVNLYHETVDAVRQGGGGSVADYKASTQGAAVGNAIRRLRDNHTPMRTRAALESIPSLIGGAFSNHPLDFARPWGADGPDHTRMVEDLGR